MDAFCMKVSLLIALITLGQMHGYTGCLEKERTALFELKAFFESISTGDVDGILTSWVDDPMSDCCRWERVMCNATTGSVIQLLLYSISPSVVGNTLLNLSLFSPFEELQSLDLSVNNLAGFYENKGSGSVGKLKKLKILGLALNQLDDSILPYLTSLTSLEILNLNFNYMEEVFRPEGGLGNLINLEMLDVSENTLNGSSSSHGLANLKRLKFLDLSENMMSGSFISHGLCKLKSLVELDLSQNNFNGHLPLCLSNLTNLKLLDLSSNQLSGSLSSVMANITSLEYISVSDNNFQGSFSFGSLSKNSKLQVLLLSNNLLQVENERFPSLPTYQLKVLQLRNSNLHAIPNFLLYQYNLSFIDLSHNKIVGNFPTWLLQNNTKLEALYLKNNSFEGILQLPNSSHNLLRLDVSVNDFNGQLPRSIGKILPELIRMNMSSNGFQGNLVSSMSEMKKLELLDLSDNNFSGELSKEFLTGCFSLSVLSLSRNKLQGKVFPEYVNLTQLWELYLDNNHFSEMIQEGLSKATSLSILDVSNNILTGKIPCWIGNLSNLEILSISKNLLVGNIPSQLSKLQFLRILEISENRLFSLMKSSFNLSSLEHLYIQKNGFNGSIANGLPRSSQLITVDMRYNQFSGSIPHWINEYSNLRILLLKRNHLRGHIPNQLCELELLRILDVSYNKLNGSIPLCLVNMRSWMQKIDFQSVYENGNEQYSRDDFLGSFYNSTVSTNWFEEEYFPSGQREVEFMTKNRYEFYKGDILNYMAGLDLSCNELTGGIPPEIGKLQEIRALNLSHNILSGSIPESLSNLKMIESLDFSYNKFSGQIPPRMAELNFLSNFNVSYNNLSGPIPNTGQFATFDESSYVGNPGLCGLTIHKSCTNGVDWPILPPSGVEEDESAVDMASFYSTFAASYVIVLLGLFTILSVSSYWRIQWYFAVDVFIGSCFHWLFKYVPSQSFSRP